jgi:hypothetical protein
MGVGHGQAATNHGPSKKRPLREGSSVSEKDRIVPRQPSI